MDDSILNDLKKMLGIDTELNVFDQDLIIHINSVFMTLHQLGVLYLEFLGQPKPGQTF